MRKLPIARAFAASSAAIPIYLHLLERAATPPCRLRIVTSREALAKAIGINRMPTISKAIAVLADLGLIRHRARNRPLRDGKYAGKYLEITLQSSQLTEALHLHATPRRGTKNVSMVTQPTPRRGTKNVSWTNPVCPAEERKTLAVSLREREAGTDAPLIATHRPATTTAELMEERIAQMQKRRLTNGTKTQDATAHEIVKDVETIQETQGEEKLCN